MQFKIYRSSAGSGKTFSLTKEYLKLALTGGGIGSEFSPRYFKSILAITFTRMASSEMKERILKQLKIFSGLKESQTDPMLALIHEELSNDFNEQSVPDKQELCSRAAQVHREILHNYTDFSVSTIDSFHKRVVQAFTQDLALPYNFEMEENSEGMVEEVIELLQNQVQKTKDPAIEKVLKQIILKNIEFNKSLFFESELSNFLKILQKENAHPYIEKAQKFSSDRWIVFEKELWKFIKTKENQIKHLGEEALKIIHDKGIDKASFYNKAAIYGYFLNASTNTQKFLKDEFKNAYKTINEDKWTATKVALEAKNSIEEIKPHLILLFNKLEEFRSEEFQSKFIAVTEVRKHILYIGLLRAVSLELEKIKYERGVVFFYDLTLKINEIIEKDPIPYIYERMGEKFNHILIDEFQDTSKMQWHNLLPLITNSLAKQRFSMVVGDTKQSIYRWRGGLADMLATLPEVPTLKEDSAALQEVNLLKRYHKVENLVTNRRSQKGIIEFNNKLYNHLRASYGETYPMLEQFYNEVTQEYHKEGSSLVNIDFIESESKLYNEATSIRVEQKINQSIQENFRYKDIAILVRKNTHAAILAQNLLKKNIPIISNESLLLIHSESVRFLIGFMKLLVVPLSPKEKMELIKFLYENKSADTKSGDQNGISGSQFLEVSQRIHNPDPMVTIEYILEHFTFSIDVKSWVFLPLYDLAEQIASSFKLWESDVEIIYIQKAFDFIKKHALSKSNQIKSFLDYWDKKKEKLSLQLPDSENAVKIITIHKSKGLEFPIVIIPYTDWSTKPKPNDLLWGDWEQDIIDLDFGAFTAIKGLEKTPFNNIYSKEKEAVFTDAINVLYVGTTRAEKQLHIIAKNQKITNSGINSVNQLLKEYAESQAFDTTETTLKLSDAEVAITQITIEETKTEEPLPSEPLSPLNTELLQQRSYGEAIHSIRVERENSGKRAPLVSDFNKAKQKGVLLHYIFEKIQFMDEVDIVIEELILSGYILPAQKEDIKERVLSVISLSEIKYYFDRKSNIQVLNERTLIGKEILRPDRIVVEPQQITIIDYKTGKFNKTHENQVIDYMQLINNMGYKTTKGFLVYTETPEVVEVKS